MPVLVALAGVLLLARERKSVAVQPVQQIAPRPVELDVPPPPKPRVVLERPARDVALVARELRIPVSVALGEKLVVVKRETGYTHVVLEREGRPAETRMVAEPGDAIEVHAGGQVVETQPGESIAIEKAEGELVWIAVTR